MINYTSGKSAQGSGAHNHTVEWGIAQNGTAAAATSLAVSAMAPTVPETNHFFTAVGARLAHINATVPAGFIIQVERLAAEGGIAWEVVYQDQVSSDSELGTYFAFAQMRALFNRWLGDPDTDRMDIETAHRWRLFNFATAGWNSLTMLLTYHTITYTVADSISGFSGTVDISAHRESGEKVLETSRAGDGAFSMTWFDNTEELYVVADDGTNVGRSTLTLASGSP